MNIHKELIEEYAKDWMETDKPWNKWECKGQHHSQWNPLTTHPQWDASTQYRRREPKIIQIGSMEVPEPVREGLRLDECYYLPSLFANNPYEIHWWRNTPQCKRLLANGLLHRTKENAIAHAKALLQFTQEGDTKWIRRIP